MLHFTSKSRSIVLALIIFMSLVFPVSNVSADAAPVITIFYGTTQSFGSLGNPQGQIAILGNVSGAVSLSYTLNSDPTPRPLSLGPDGRRLLNSGDFAVEIFDGELIASNTIVITALSAGGVPATETVTVNYSRDNQWPLPYTIPTWTNVQSQAQVVDGNWSINGGKLVNNDVGYDRMVAFGDMGWEDYELAVDFTPSAVDPGCGSYPYYDCGGNSYSPAIGVILRWTGHTNEPSTGITQPFSGWLPLGAIGWYRWNVDGEGNGARGIYHDADTTNYASTPSTLPLNTTYTLRFRVQTVDDLPVYSLKIWVKGQDEPTDWDITWTGAADDPRSGSVVLFAHHVAVAWGAVSVTPLSPGIQSASITSDDFNECSLDTDLWEYYTPVNQGISTASLTGSYSGDAKVSMFIPGGLAADQNPYELHNDAARLRQVVTQDGDFAVEAKFTSIPSSDIQMQGLMLEETSPENFLRAEFYSFDGSIYLYARSFYGTESITYVDKAISTIATPGPLYLQLVRMGDDWRLNYKIGSGSWITGVHFPLLFATKYIGVFAGNALDASAPNNTVVVDYFRDINDTTFSDDSAQNAITFTKVGNGVTAANPSSSNYACNASVEVSATADAGWTFDSWSDAITGSVSPQTVIMDGPKAITATFTQNTYTITTHVDPASSGTVGVSVAGPYTYGQNVDLTATPENGWLFTGWTGDITSTDNPLSVTVQQNYDLTANFEKIEYTITANVSPSAGGSIQKADGPYYYDDVIAVTAVENPGWTFSNWSGDLSSTDNPLSVTVTQNVTITANFTQNHYTVSAVASPIEGGTVDVPDGPFVYNDEVIVTATPQTGWTFSGWSGTVESGDNPLTVTVTQNTSLTATFIQTPYYLTKPATISGGSIQFTPNKAAYALGDHVQVLAVPQDGWKFVSWQGDLSGTENPTEIVVNGDMNLSALFQMDLKFIYLPFITN